MAVERSILYVLIIKSNFLRILIQSISISLGRDFNEAIA
jgi:hypothetical protein